MTFKLSFFFNMVFSLIFLMVLLFHFMNDVCQLWLLDLFNLLDLLGLGLVRNLVEQELYVVPYVCDECGRRVAAVRFAGVVNQELLKVPRDVVLSHR